MKTKSFASLFFILALFGASAGVAFADAVTLGTNVTMTATADGTAPFTYQWTKAGVNIPGATNAILTIASFAATDAATYGVTISNSAGSISTTAVLSQEIIAPSNPKIGIVQKVISWIRAFFKNFV
jgi:hypothetical protein